MRLDALKRRPWLGALLLLFLSSCSTTPAPRPTQLSYGGGIGGTGITSGGIGGTGITSGGIGGTGITGYGMVQGFGSIFVMGKEYFLSRATRIEVNGHPGAEKDLHVGDVVALEGARDPRTGRYYARRVNSEYQLQGVVQAVDPRHTTLRLLGQTVYVAPRTRLENVREGSKLTLNSLRAGDVLGVSGFSREGAHWLATRLVRLYPAGHAPRTPRFILRGRLERSGKHPFARVNGQDVRLTGPAPRADIRPGSMVVVRGEYQHGVLKATDLRPERLLTGKAGERVEMEGYIHSLPRPGHLLVNGLVATYHPGMAGEPPAAHLQTDELVQMRGVWRRNGTIRLEQIERYRDIPHLPERPLSRSERSRSAGEGSASRINKPEQRRPEKPEMQRPEVQRPEMERPEAQRPEVERPQVQRPDVERAQVQRPEVEHPEPPEKPD